MQTLILPAAIIILTAEQHQHLVRMVS